MKFSQWISQLLGQPTLQEVTLPTVVDPLEEEANGLNFRSAIEAHQRWKARLTAILDGTSNENIDLAVVSADTECVLGKWIHGVGGQQFGELPDFQLLQVEHEKFHKMAGEVLYLTQLGREIEARRLLNSDYTRLSQRIVVNLARLYTQTANGQRKIA